MSTGFKINRPDSFPNNAPTICVGLVGRGIQLSRTPALHEMEGGAQGMRYVYRLFDCDTLAANDDLQGIVKAAELCGYAGLNVTYPFKKKVMSLVDELSDDARRIGSVNTVVFKNAKRYGENTDMWGFAQSMREGLPDCDKSKVILIGAGGAGCAVANALIDLGVQELCLFDQDITVAKHLCDSLQAQDTQATVRIIEDLALECETATGIVNATPVGMAKLPGCPLPKESLRQDMWVADIVYFPLETELLKTARAMGCETLSGSGMAIYQAVRSFEIFSGVKADAERMRKSFEAFSN